MPDNRKKNIYIYIPSSFARESRRFHASLGFETYILLVLVEDASNTRSYDEEREEEDYRVETMKGPGRLPSRCMRHIPSDLLYTINLFVRSSFERIEMMNGKESVGLNAR